jgi:predicted phage replisome organizer
MADVKWIKIVTDVFDDEKILMIETMPESDTIIVIWFKLLCLAGKQNNSGVFQMGQMPYTDEMFATIFRRPLNTVRLALKTFEQFGMIEIIHDTVTIPNWGKHQSIDQIEAKNAYMKKYMREYREKQKLISSGKSNCKTNSKANVSEADKIREEEIREDKSRGDIEGVTDINVGTKPSKRFSPPTVEEVAQYCFDRMSCVDPQRFVDYYTSNGWMVGKNKMKDWKAAVRTWEQKDKPQSRASTKSNNPFLDMVGDGYE